MFVCKNCKAKINDSPVGSKHRNHCPKCLYSLHLDNFPGDRASECGGLMEPIGLTFKETKGELMLVHKCTRCGAYSKNRLAGDDLEDSIVSLYKATRDNPIKTVVIEELVVRLLDSNDEREIMTQLYGKNYLA